MTDRFTKNGWVTPLNYNKTETILTAQKYTITHNIFDWYQTDNEESSKTMFLKKFMNRKELLESVEYIITLRAKEQQRYSIELLKSHSSAKKHKKKI